MIRHYLTVTVRKLRAHPGAWFANVATLAIGLTCFLAAYGATVFFLSGDIQHLRAGRVVVIAQRFDQPGGQATNATPLLSSGTLSKYVKQDVPSITAVARAVGVFDVGLVAGERKLLIDAAYVDPEFLDLFALDTVAGNSRAALAAAGSVILTADAAVRLFGDSEAVGRFVRVDDAWDAVVAAVIAQVRQPSFMGTGRDLPLPFSMLASPSNLRTAPNDERDNWLATNGFTFASLPPTLSRAALEAELAALADRRLPPGLKQRGFSFEAFPVAEMTARRLNNQLLAGSAIGLSATQALLGLGVLALVVACVSYASLASAQSVARAKEIGMRRVLGARRRQVMAQCLTEALVSAAAAALIALATTALAAPLIERWTDVDVRFFLERGLAPWAVIAGAVGAVALCAGAYPAFVLARIPPLHAVLPGRSRLGPRRIARLLVCLQFAGASFLLIVVTVIQLERGALERLALPAHGDPVVVLGDLRPQRVDFTTLEAALRRIPGVKNVALVNATPWGNAAAISFARTRDDAATARVGFIRSVTPEYFATLGLGVAAGRVFDRDRDRSATSTVAADDSNNVLVVVDRVFASRLGFANPRDAVDQLIYPPAGAGSRPLPPARIIGVTDAEAGRLEASPASGYAYTFGQQTPTGRQVPLVRIAAENVEGTVGEIVRAWDLVAPTVPLNVRFLADLFEQRFRPYARTGGVLLFLAASALAVSSIGQLGIAMHSVRRRKREMGVRRTLGCSVGGLLRVLLTDLSTPVVVGNIAAWPFAYFAAATYLQAFSQRIALTPWPFIASLAVTLAVASGVVGAEVSRAANVRPVDALREP